MDLFPVLARLKERGAAGGVPVWPGNNIGYFGPYETLLRLEFPRRHTAHCGAGCNTLGREANGAVKGCPSLSAGCSTAAKGADASADQTSAGTGGATGSGGSAGTGGGGVDAGPNGRTDARPEAPVAIYAPAIALPRNQA